MASNYNSRPLPAEVLVQGDRLSLIRRRQTREDLIAGRNHDATRTDAATCNGSAPSINTAPDITMKRLLPLLILLQPAAWLARRAPLPPTANTSS